MKANNMKKFLLALLFAPIAAIANSGSVHLDKAPDGQGDKAGAKVMNDRARRLEHQARK